MGWHGLARHNGTTARQVLVPFPPCFWPPLWLDELRHSMVHALWMVFEELGREG